MWMDLAGFAGIMALGQMTPGPDWILVTRCALAHGLRTAIWTATGITCGLMVHATLAVGGLAVYVRANEAAWNAARWLAAGYLVWMGVSILRDTKRDGADSRKEKPGMGGTLHPFLRGFGCNLLNAKVCLLLAAVCATYLNGDHPAHWPAILWGVIVIQGWALWILWAALLQNGSVRKAYGRFQHWLDIGFGTGLLLLAVRVLVSS
jgi:threonine efflux protein